MKTFKNMGELITALTVPDKVIHGIVQQGAQHLKDKAYAKVGTYQAGWPKLAESTERQKARRGYPTNAPLLASGAMRDSFGFTTDSDEQGAMIGATDPKAVVHELGKGRTPARPVFGPLVYEEKEALVNIAVEALKQHYGK